jgi:hypothetical protein
MTRERMSFVDHAWLRMDRPNNWMVITGLMVFDIPMDVERFKERVQAELLRYPRFHQRVQRPPRSFQLGLLGGRPAVRPGGPF